MIRRIPLLVVATSSSTVAPSAYFRLPLLRRSQQLRHGSAALSAPGFLRPTRTMLQAAEFGDEEVWAQREFEEEPISDYNVGGGADEVAVPGSSLPSQHRYSTEAAQGVEQEGQQRGAEMPVEEDEEQAAASRANALLRDFTSMAPASSFSTTRLASFQSSSPAADGSAATRLFGARGEGAEQFDLRDDEDISSGSLEQESKSGALSTSPSQMQQQQQRQHSPQVDEASRRLAAVLHAAVANYTPGPDSAAIGALLAEVNSPRDLNRIVEELVKPNPGMHDLANGHGFRVFVFGKVAAAAAKLGDTGSWLRLMRLVRSRGFKLTRTYIAYFLETLKKETSLRFIKEGRNPAIASDAISSTRTICRFAEEDGVAFDWVLMSRVLFVVTGVVAVFDRQNVYRSNWPPSGEVPRREGIVSEWVIAHERPPDYDRVIQLCDGVVADLVTDVKTRFRCRPPFSFLMRLADYFFATDNLEKMLAVMEDALDSGVPIGESSTAKLLQLACAFNHPEVPRIFLKFRVMQPQCMLVAPDFSRLLMWYCRSGGGHPCPECGEIRNHRDVSLEQWHRHRGGPLQEREWGCPLLHDARVRRGELENNPAAPQCRDWSVEAMQLYELSQARAIAWTPVEWRAFIMCHMFAPREKALAALELLEGSLERTSWDEFLSSQVMRLLRHHDPRRIIPTLRRWHAVLSGTNDENDTQFSSPRQGGSAQAMSPLVVQEAAMGVIMLSDVEARIEALNYLTEAARQCEIYSMSYTQRVLQARLQKLNGTGATNEAEKEAVSSFSSIMPRAIDTAEIKDSCSDLKPAPNKRATVYGSK